MIGADAEAPDGTASGLDPHLASALAYLAWWVTGVLFLLVERRNPHVRFHAAQSAVVFGGLSALMCLSYGAALVLMVLSGAGVAFRALMAVTNLTWLLAAVLWAWLILKALRGEQWRVPAIGWLVDRLAATGPGPRT